MNAYATYTDAIDAAASLYDQHADLAIYVAEGDVHGEYLRAQCETIARLFPLSGMTTEDRAAEVRRDISAMVKKGAATR